MMKSNLPKYIYFIAWRQAPGDGAVQQRHQSEQVRGGLQAVPGNY